MTKKNIRPDTLRLKDILQAIADIGEIDLKTSSPRKDVLASAYAIAIIGEAVSHVSPELKKEHPQIPWRSIIGMRHKIIHEYGKIDIGILLNVIANDLPILKQQIAAILEALS